LELKSCGYRRHVQTVHLEVNQEVRAEVPLRPGTATESANVTATRSLARTDTASVGGVIDNRQVQACRWTAASFMSSAWCCQVWCRLQRPLDPCAAISPLTQMAHDGSAF